VQPNYFNKLKVQGKHDIRFKKHKRAVDANFKYAMTFAQSMIDQKEVGNNVTESTDSSDSDSSSEEDLQNHQEAVLEEQQSGDQLENNEAGGEPTEESSEAVHEELSLDEIVTQLNDLFGQKYNATLKDVMYKLSRETDPVVKDKYMNKFIEFLNAGDSSKEASEKFRQELSNYNAS
jgi:hypothetical protein